MGGTLVKYTENATSTTLSMNNCLKDADCYTAKTTLGQSSGGWNAITTDADKAKSCCMYSRYVSTPEWWTGAYDTMKNKG